MCARVNGQKRARVIVALVTALIAMGPATARADTTPTSTTVEMGPGAVAPDALDVAVQLGRTDQRLTAVQQSLADLQAQQAAMTAVLQDVDSRIAAARD